MNPVHAQRVYFEQLKRAVSIEAVLARYGIELKRKGGSLKGALPHPQRQQPDAVRGVEWPVALLFARVQSRRFDHRIRRRDGASRNPRCRSHDRALVRDLERSPHQPAQCRGEQSENAFWTRVGSAWPHKDGKGLNVQIAAGVAVSGRLVLREYTDDDAKEEEQQKSSRRKK